MDDIERTASSIYGLFCFFTGGLLGFLFGYGIGIDRNIPQKVLQRDVDNDGRQDAIIYSRSGSSYLFLGQTDGSYKPSDEVFNEQKNNLESRVKELQLERDYSPK